MRLAHWALEWLAVNHTSSPGGEHLPLRDHILATMDRIQPFAEPCQASGALAMLRQEVQDNRNDARWLRERQAEERLLGEVIRQAAQRFRGRAA